jgi:alkylated DNA repair dioxygenase AlkB
MMRETGKVPAVINSDAVSERLALDETSWVDVTRGWMTGADELYEHLFNTVAWQTSQLFRYEQFVEERRLGSSWRRGTPLPHQALADATRAIQRRYKVEFPGFSMIQYRNGDDGQGFHRDTDMRWLDDTIIGVLTLGAQRPWRLRPRANRFVDSPTKGATHDLAPESGDLIVMGGRCQADWEHSVPYLKGREGLGVSVRISLQWRATRKTGEPFMGPSFRAAVGYGHGKAAPTDA